MSSTVRPNPPPAEPLIGAHTQLIWHDTYDPARRRAWISLTLLLAITALAYVPALSAQFPWRDDQAITAIERLLQDGVSRRR